MKLIKVANLEDKLKRAGNPIDPLLVQVCRLDDTKNLLKWNNIKGEEKSLEKELENFFSSGKALKVVKSQLNKTKSSCKEALLFEHEKERKPEISTQDRKRISGYLENVDDWEKCLFDKKDVNYKKSKAFLYIMIASDSILNQRLTPSYDLLQQIHTEFSKDTSKEQIEELSNDEELVKKLKDVGIDDFSGGISGLSSDIQKSLGIFRDEIEKKKIELEWLVGFDPTLYDSLPIDDDKEKYRGMDFDEVKEMIYKEYYKIPEHAKEKALEGILKATKKYLLATPVEELGDEDRAHFEELKSSLFSLKAKRDYLHPIFEDIVYSRSKGESQIAELCESVQVQTEEDVEIKADFTKDLEDGWYSIPGGNASIKPIKHSGIDLRDRFPDTDWKKKSNRIQFVSLVSAGTGWCINQLSFARSYIGTGDNVLYVENGGGKVCIRYGRSKMSEFTGFNNRPINLVPYADKIFDLCEQYPNIAQDFKKFTPGKNHGSLEGIKKDIVGVEEHNKLTPKELAAKIEADVVNPKYGWKVDHEVMSEWQRRTTSDYLYDDKVIECSSCPEFVAAMKKQWMIMENNEKDTLAGRFPFLKKDDEVIDKAIEVVKDELKYIVSSGNDMAMRAINLINMCNQFGQIPLKDPEVRDLAFKAYSKLSGESNPNEKTQNILTHLRVIVKEAGAFHLFQDVAAEEGLEAIAEGNFDKFSNLKEDFDLSANVSDIKEEAFEGLIEKATLLYLNDSQAFENLNKLFDGRFTEPEVLKRIKENAKVEANKKALKWIEIFDDDYLQNKLRLLFERFPELNKDPAVLNAAIEKSTKLIVDDNELFFALDHLFDGVLSKGTYNQKIIEQSRDYAIDKVVHMIDLVQLKNHKLKYMLFSFPDLKSETRVVNSALRIADSLIIDNPEDFKNLDDMLDNVLTKGDYYESILKKAQPRAVKKAKESLKKDDFSAFFSLAEKFPKVKDDLNIVNIITSKIVNMLVQSKTEEPKALVKLMGYNSYDLDHVYDKVFDKILNKAKKCMSQWDLEGLAKLDRMTGRKLKKNKETGNLEVAKPGKVFGERRSEIIEGSKEMALTHILSKLLVWTNIKKEKDPIGKLITMDQVYGGTFLTDSKVKDRCRIIYLKSKGFLDEPFFAEIVKKIESIFGNDLVTDQDLQRFRKKQIRNVAIKSEEALEKEDFETLKKNFANFPELKEDKGLLRRSMQFVYNSSMYVATDNLERLHQKKFNSELLNSLFEGQILSSRMGSEGYGKIKRAFDKAQVSSFMGEKPQQNVTNDTFNMKEHKETPLEN